MRLDLIATYLDPTTGSLGYQVAISGIITAAATCRIYWQRIRGLFRKEPPAGKTEAEVS